MFPIEADGQYARNSEKMLILNQAMQERFVTRRWTRPLPLEGRVPTFPRCARCFARFVCEHKEQQPVDGAARGEVWKGHV